MPAVLNENLHWPIFFVCERIMAQFWINRRIVRVSHEMRYQGSIVNRKLALQRKAKPRVGRLTIVKNFLLQNLAKS